MRPRLILGLLLIGVFSVYGWTLYLIRTVEESFLIWSIAGIADAIFLGSLLAFWPLWKEAKKKIRQSPFS